MTVPYLYIDFTDKDFSSNGIWSRLYNTLGSGGYYGRISCYYHSENTLPIFGHNRDS